jgi:cytochrome c oxidase assembly protein subunit 15
VGSRSFLARPRRGKVTPGGFRRIAVVALAGLFVVVVTGAVVRLTASGLGCDNWPRCGDTPFPERDFHAAVEFGNRVVALIAIVLSVVAAVAARRVEGLPRWVARLALLVALGTIAQIPLGGVTVILDLHPLAVMSHFLLALAMLACSVLVALQARAFEAGRGASAVPRPLAWLSLGLLPVGLAVVVTGAFVTAAGPHSGGSDIRRLGNLEDAIYVHVRATAVFGVGFLLLLAALVRLRSRARGELVLAAGALALLLVQMGIGEYQWRNQLPWGIVLLHVGLGAGVWATLVALAVRLVWAAGLTRAPAVGRSAMPAPRSP